MWQCGDILCLPFHFSRRLRYNNETWPENTSSTSYGVVKTRLFLLHSVRKFFFENDFFIFNFKSNFSNVINNAIFKYQIAVPLYTVFRSVSRLFTAKKSSNCNGCQRFCWKMVQFEFKKI